MEEFRNTVYAHYRESGRTFPWRETRDPYRILVSELMLQQTQTERVVPKYLDWLERFPTVESLAESPFQAVLEKWVGLGYNRRAKYLHEAAKAVVRDFGGAFPQDAKSLMRLPGVGHYTASAVSTFSFGIPNAFIETNIRAVYLFFFLSDGEGVHDDRIMELVEATMDREDPRSWYYALMDYGATLKKKVVNPNRKSRHYTKQSRFTGSLREARGAVVRYIGKTGPSRVDEIALAEGIEIERITRAAKSLVDDGMVAETDGVYRISG